MCITRRRTKQEVYNSRICVVEVHTQQKSGGRGGGGGCFGGGGGGGGGGDLRDDDDYEDSIKRGRNQGHGVGAGESGVKNDGASPGDATIGGGGNNIKGGGNQNHGGGAAKNGGKNDGMTPGEAETINSSGDGGENNIWGRGSRNQGDHGAAKNGGIYNGMSPGDSRYTNIGGGNRRENEDANSGTDGGGRNHTGHVSKTAEGGGGNMSHMGPTDSSDAKSSHTSVDELPRDVMGSTKAYRHVYAGPQSEINYAPAPVMQPYPVVNSYVLFFGEKKTKGCSIM